jgi:hypothetical protein
MPTEIQSHQTLMKDRSPSPNVTKNPLHNAGITLGACHASLRAQSNKPRLCLWVLSRRRRNSRVRTNSPVGLCGWLSTEVRLRSRGKPSASSTQISAFHSVVIRIRGLALNSAKTDSKNSTMCRPLRTVDRKLSWFCSRRASLSPGNPGESLSRGWPSNDCRR